MVPNYTLETVDSTVEVKVQLPESCAASQLDTELLDDKTLVLAGLDGLSLSLSIPLPFTVDSDTVKVKLKKQVLTFHAEKKSVANEPISDELALLKEMYGDEVVRTPKFTSDTNSRQPSAASTSTPSATTLPTQAIQHGVHESKPAASSTCSNSHATATASACNSHADHAPSKAHASQSAPAMQTTGGAGQMTLQPEDGKSKHTGPVKQARALNCKDLAIMLSSAQFSHPGNRKEKQEQQKKVRPV